MSMSKSDLKTMEDSYARLESPKMGFNDFLSVLRDFNIALLTPQNEDCDYPTDSPFFIEVKQTASSEGSDIEGAIYLYQEKKQDWDQVNCEYNDCYQSSMDWEYWTQSEPSQVVVSSRPFTEDEIIVTMTSDGNILCEDHPNMVYLDDFMSVYQKMQEACPDII